MKNGKVAIAICLCCLGVFGGWVAFNDTKCDGETFDGEDRETAKTTIGTGTTQTMTVDEFLSTYKDKPEDLDDHSPRSTIEQKNIKVTAWLYTYAREGDEDYHLILGNTDKKKGRKFMSAEISGLPKHKSSKDYQHLLNAREQFKKLFLDNSDYCGGFKKSLTKKLILVTVTGSLFFDTHHASGGSGTGEFKSHSPWELHPITHIKLGKDTE